MARASLLVHALVLVAAVLLVQHLEVEAQGTVIRGPLSFPPSASTVLNAGSVAEVPIVTDIIPKRGVRAGGQTVTLSGARMVNSPKATCMFKDGREIRYAKATWLSSVQVTCVTPPRTAGNTGAAYTNGSVFVSVAVSNDGVTYSGAVYGVPDIDGAVSGDNANVVWSGTVVQYEYITDEITGMAIDSIWPTVGPYEGGTLLTIYGQKILAGWNLKCKFETSAPLTSGLTPPGGSTGSDYVNATATSETRALCETLPYSSTPPALDPGLDVTATVKLNAHSFNTSLDFGSANFTYKHVLPVPTTFKAPTIIPTLCVRQDPVAPATFGLCGVMASLTATPSRFAARSPVTGNTELTIIGTNFLPSKNLKCGFGATHASTAPTAPGTTVSAIWDSETQIRCVTPAYNPHSNVDCTIPANCLGVRLLVSNNGKDWSNATLNAVNPAGNFPHNYANNPNYLILFSDLHVSPYGHDSTGDGTASKPFRTIQRAIDMANPDDRIYVQQGRYTGLGNIGLRSYGKKLQLYGDGLTQTVIDCEHSNIGFIVDVPYFGSNDPYVGVINYKDIAVLGCDAQKLWN
eukprot:tig00022075_g23609.t1